MLTVKTISRSEYKTKSSKFYGYLLPAASEDTFNLELYRLKSEHNTATHHCYAYRINPFRPEEFETDDGEPSGTAGQQILNRMRSSELINCGLVVVRYYGGTKLGKSGLIEAYSETADKCIRKADLRKVFKIRLFEISYTYEQQSHVNQLIHAFNLAEENSVYREKVTLILGCDIERVSGFQEKLNSIRHLFESTDDLGESIRIE